MQRVKRSRQRQQRCRSLAAVCSSAEVQQPTKRDAFSRSVLHGVHNCAHVGELRRRAVRVPYTNRWYLPTLVVEYCTWAVLSVKITHAPDRAPQRPSCRCYRRCSSTFRRPQTSRRDRALSTPTSSLHPDVGDRRGTAVVFKSPKRETCDLLPIRADDKKLANYLRTSCEPKKTCASAIFQFSRRH